MLELLDGDLIFTKSINAHYFDKDGLPVVQASFNAGRKRKFAFMLLCAVEEGKETKIDIDTVMKYHGWIRDPEAQ